MNNQFEEKIKKIRDAINFKHTSTVPTFSNTTGWVVHDSKYHFSEVYYDWKKTGEALIEYGERYNFDSYLYNGAIYNLPFTDALGGGGYRLDMRNGALSVVDNSIVFPDDYEDYGKDPSKFMQRAFARKYPNLTTPMFEKAINEFLKFGQFMAKVDEKVFKKRLQSPLMFTLQSNVMPSIEILNAGLRGIKDLAVDIRRHKDKLMCFLDANWEKNQLPALEKNLQTQRPDYVCELYTAMLAHAYLSTKQFEELYWPHFKQIIDAAVKSGKILFIFCESEILRYAEFFQDIPKGAAVLHIENDDIYEIRKKLPNLCIAGGFPIGTLGYGTPEQCVDTAKRLIDGMGEGYILSTTKIAAYANDAKRENLLALMDFVHNYKI